VVDHHLLIVTRAFEDQENWLNERDFAALWACMQEIDGLAFYNGGKIAGASQKHKHLQLVPLPFVPQKENLPITPAIASAVFDDSLGKIPSFPFCHGLAKLNLTSSDSPETAAQAMLSCYYFLLESVGLSVNKNNEQQSGAYNLLATKEWMLIVPRSQESFQSISINSLGFAGSLFVRDRQQKKILKQLSPMTILSNVATLKN
jgi:ATP adenylyltransferase